MSGIDFEDDLSSGDVVQVCKALRVLAGPRSGPIYPRGQVLALLGPEHPDRVRENALVLLLRRGQHPLEHRRILNLLQNSSEKLFATLIGHVVKLAFPSASEDTLFWCWSKRTDQVDRMTILRIAERLGPLPCRRLIQRTRLLEDRNQFLVCAGLSLLARVGAPHTRELFENALTHRNPRFRSIALEHLAPRWNNQERRSHLLALRQDPNHRVRSTAAVLAFPEDAEGSIEVLRAMIHAENPMTRAAAAWGLGELAGQHPHCHPLLGRLRQDSDPRVAKRANRSLAGVR